jgi:RHS repeat-associated protein
MVSRTRVARREASRAWILAIACAAAWPFRAGAEVRTPAPGAVSAETLTLPDKPASVKGLADPATLNAFSGQIAYSIPILLPSGPAGFGPSMALTYSGELGDGPVGVGWTLGTIAIRRTLREGVPRYTDQDELELVGVGPGGRLYTFDGQRYWVEGAGTSIRVDRRGTWFEVTDSNGMKYILGLDANSRQEDGGRIFTWLVRAIVDVTRLQQIDFVYEHDGNAVYPHSIAWGPPIATGGAPAFQATVELEDRPDVVVSWATGFEVHTRKRVDSIRVSSFGEIVRTYKLGYLPTNPSFRLSRLISVEMSGLERAGVPLAAMPTTRFKYVPPTNQELIKVENLDGWVLNERGTSLVDVDGDGMADLYRMEQGQHFYRKGNGKGFSGNAHRVLGAEDTDLEGTRLMDLDGDARPDLVRVVNDTWRWSRLEAVSPATLDFRWVNQGEWFGTTGVPIDDSALFVDLNGDGRTDVVQGAAGALLVRMNGPEGLGPVRRRPQISPVDAVVEPGSPYVHFQDLNGDHLADVIWCQDEWMKVWLGRGDGTFVPLNVFRYPWGRGAFSDQDIRFADLDRDGFTDLIRITDGYVSWSPGLPEGGFSADLRVLKRPAAGSVDSVVTIADVNGSGSQQVVWSTNTGMWLLDLAGHGAAGMIQEMDNGLGMTTQVTYSTSALLAVADEAAGRPWSRKLPSNVPVPIIMQNVLASGEPIRPLVFGVRDGVWDGTERTFAGFLLSGRTVPGATARDTLHEETRYLAGLGRDRTLRGKTELVRRETGNGVVIDETENRWLAMQVTSLPEHPWAKKPAHLAEVRRRFEGVSTPIESVSTFEFDDEVRTIREHHKGRTDLTGDEKEVERTYASDDTFWVRDRVCDEKLLAGDGTTLVSHVRTYFGDHTPTVLDLCKVGQGWTRVTKGFFQAFLPGDPGYVPTEPSEWIDLTRQSYDNLGNVLVSYEAGIERTVTYDARGLRPLTETVEPGGGKTALTWSTTWDDAQGLPLTAKDPNDVINRVEYDGLGREISVQLEAPGMAPPFKPHLYYEYDFTAPRSTVTTSSFDGPLGPENVLNRTLLKDAGDPRGRPFAEIDSSWQRSISVSNGAGEELYAATQLTADRWVVNKWKERDAQGSVVLVADPFYFSGAAPPTTRPQTGVTFQTLHYDAAGRLDKQTLPNGNEKRIEYRAFMATTTDSGMAAVTSKLDGLGRIARTERTVNGIVESADATYDASGRLTSISLQEGEATHLFRYDTLGRLRYASDPDVGPRYMRYDARNFLARRENGAHEVVGFEYDGVGRLTRRGPGETRPSPQDYVYRYDDGEPGIPQPAYTRGRLAGVDEPAGLGPSPGKVVLSYDALGRENINQRTLGTTVGWERSILSPSGLLLRESSGDGYLLEPEYDRAGRITRLGNIWQVGAAGVTGDSLDASGRVLAETYGNGLVQTYGRDSLGYANDIVVRNPANQQNPLLYSILVSQRTPYGAPEQVVDRIGGGKDHNASYHYDLAGRLDAATLGSGPLEWRFRYRYDGLQNMTARFQKGPVEAGIGVISGYYRYGDKNGHPGPRQLTSITHVDCPGTETTMDYDDAGRLHREGQRTLTYDAFDQLIRIDEPGSTPLETNVYGHEGLRTFSDRGGGDQQIWFSSGHTLKGSQRLHYVMVSDRLVARLTFPSTPVAALSELVPVVTRERRDGSGWVQQGPRLYLFGLGLFGLAALVGSRRIRRPRWLSASAVGAACAILAPMHGCSDVDVNRQFAELAGSRIYFHQGIAAGPTLLTTAGPNPTVFDERRFEPFGQPLDVSVAALVGKDPYNNLNKETDAKTGWSYHGARWMAPQTARWLAPDPAIREPEPKTLEAPWELNPYQYATQNPTLFWDPDGEQTGPIAKGAQWAIRKALQRVMRGAGYPGHILARHIAKIIGKSTFGKPAQVMKLLEETLKNPTKVILQKRFGGSPGVVYERVLVQKQFNRVIGRDGETVVNIVIDRLTGRIVTGFPGKVLLGTAFGATALGGAMEGHAAASEAYNKTGKRNIDPMWEWLMPIGASPAGTCSDLACQKAAEQAVAPMRQELVPQLEHRMQMTLTPEAREAAMEMFNGAAEDLTVEPDE